MSVILLYVFMCLLFVIRHNSRRNDSYWNTRFFDALVRRLYEDIRHYLCFENCVSSKAKMRLESCTKQKRKWYIANLSVPDDMLFRTVFIYSSNARHTVIIIIMCMPEGVGDHVFPQCSIFHVLLQFFCVSPMPFSQVI